MTNIISDANEYLGHVISSHQSPGLQYCIFADGKKLYEKYSGFADIENKTSIGRHTIFNGNSITKTFTALAVMQLAEKGKLELNDYLSKFLPAYPYRKGITIHQLLCHISGLPNPVPLKWIHLHSEHREFSFAGLINEIVAENKNLKSDPGAKFYYSNIGYAFLGAVIEKATGLSYIEYVRQHILNKLPLGENYLDFEVSRKSHYAKAYHPRFSITNPLLGFFIDRKKFVAGSFGRWIGFNDFYVSGISYGGLLANSEAFIVFISELTKPRSALIGDALKKYLFTPQQTNNGEKIPMCYSWFTGKLNGVDYFTHAGGGGGYYGEIRWYPERNISSAVLFNRSGMSGDERWLDGIDKYFIR